MGHLEPTHRSSASRPVTSAMEVFIFFVQILTLQSKWNICTRDRRDLRKGLGSFQLKKARSNSYFLFSKKYIKYIYKKKGVKRKVGERERGREILKKKEK